MFLLQILFLLAVVHVVYSKPLLFKEVNLKRNFEFSLKPILTPITFIKEWKPFGPVKIEHKVEKRSPLPGVSEPPLNAQPSPGPLFKIDVEKSLELHSGASTLSPSKEENLNKQPPSSVESAPVYENIHDEHFDHISKSVVGKRRARIDLGLTSATPPEIHRIIIPPLVTVPPVSPIPPPIVDKEDYLRESRLFGKSPLLVPPVPEVNVEYEKYLLVEPKPAVTPEPINENKVIYHGFSKSPSVVIQGHPPPPPPPYIPKFTASPPGNGNEGTLDSFFGPPAIEKVEKPVASQSEIKEERVPLLYRPVLPHEFTGQGLFSLSANAAPPPAGIQETPNGPTPVPPPKPRTQESNRVSLFTDISRVDEINAYIKAIDALPVVKPPLEEIVPGNSLEQTVPKATGDAKAEPSAFAKGSRLALYFGNILLQVMSQAIGSARTAIGQYSMPSMI